MCVPTISKDFNLGHAWVSKMSKNCGEKKHITRKKVLPSTKALQFFFFFSSFFSLASISEEWWQQQWVTTIFIVATTRSLTFWLGSCLAKNWSKPQLFTSPSSVSSLGHGCHTKIVMRKRVRCEWTTMNRISMAPSLFKFKLVQT